MNTQADHYERIVSLANLEAMCKQASGTCHRYSVTKVSRSRVHVEYSNPNEYGTEFPMTAVFLLIPSDFEDANPYILLHILRVIGDDRDGEGYQAFEPALGLHMFRKGPDAPFEPQEPTYGTFVKWRVKEALDKNDVDQARRELGL